MFCSTIKIDLHPRCMRTTLPAVSACKAYAILRSLVSTAGRSCLAYILTCPPISVVYICVLQHHQSCLAPQMHAHDATCGVCMYGSCDITQSGIYGQKVMSGAPFDMHTYISRVYMCFAAISKLNRTQDACTRRYLRCLRVRLTRYYPVCYLWPDGHVWLIF